MASTISLFLLTNTRLPPPPRIRPRVPVAVKVKPLLPSLTSLESTHANNSNLGIEVSFKVATLDFDAIKYILTPNLVYKQHMHKLVEKLVLNCPKRHELPYLKYHDQLQKMQSDLF